MIKYREEMRKSRVLESVTCDICKKEYSYTGNECMEAQEFQHLSVRGGYDSVFGDGSMLKADICQHCFKDKFGQYLLEDEDAII